MLDEFANVPTATRTLIRHARVWGDPLTLLYNDDGETVYCRTSRVLKLFPELALDRLTVLGSRNPTTCYETLNMLVCHGTGWKELYYLAPESAFIGYRNTFLYTTLDWCYREGVVVIRRFLQTHSKGDAPGHLGTRRERSLRRHCYAAPSTLRPTAASVCGLSPLVFITLAPTPLSRSYHPLFSPTLLSELGVKAPPPSSQPHAQRRQWL
ncbi:hypothetical protein K438DRAFT_90102 [Mycena galopus ATCC 62051]|nr:hypothetical protein K438DRAFT_90102 [Mycena galopus ATCC 62051]